MKNFTRFSFDLGDDFFYNFLEKLNSKYNRDPEQDCIGYFWPLLAPVP